LDPIRKADAQELLKPYIDRLHKVIVGKINYYFSGPAYSGVRHEHSSRSDASICHDLIKKGLEAEFEETSSVRFTKKRGLFIMVIKDTIVLRFNKFNKKLLSGGINTQQAMSLNLQDLTQLELDGMPPDALLHVGYIPNALETGVGQIHVAYRYGNDNVWTWDITSTEYVSDVLPFTGSAKEKPSRRKPKIKGKDKNVGDINAGDI
jgi:hypothetical protein